MQAMGGRSLPFRDLLRIHRVSDEKDPESSELESLLTGSEFHASWSSLVKGEEMAFQYRRRRLKVTERGIDRGLEVSKSNNRSENQIASLLFDR